MHEIKKARLLAGRENENNGNCIRLYANDIDLNYIIISSKGLVHEIGYTHDYTIADMAYNLKEMEVFD